jgi:AcrR family transcriptional regulator
VTTAEVEQVRPAEPPERVDGRRLRREQNRSAVIDALVELLGSGRFDASTTEIAEAAGLSPRSLFRYFDDADDLLRAAIAQHHRRARPHLVLGVSAADPLPARIEGLVAGRLRLWEVVEPTARVARMRAPIVPLLATELARNRAIQREQIRALLAPELDAMPEEEARSTLAAAEVLCSFESWDLLRRDQGLTAEQAGAALTRGLTALLAPGGAHR